MDEHSYVRLKGSEVAPFMVERTRTRFKSTVHCLLQSLIEIGADQAHGETCYVAWLVNEEAGVEVLDQAAGRYVDRFDKRAGEWRIPHRVVLPDVGVRLQGGQTGLLSYLDDRPMHSRDDVSYRRPLG